MKNTIWCQMWPKLILYSFRLATLTLAQEKKTPASVVKSYIAVPDVKHPATFKDSNQTLVPVQHWSICWISFSTISKLVQSCPINHQWLQLGWHDDRLFHYYETHIPKLQRSRISHVLRILQTPKVLWNRKPSRPSLSIPDSQPHSLFPFRFSPISSLSQILRIKTIQTCKTYPAWSTCDVPHFFSPTHEKNTPLTTFNTRKPADGQPTHRHRSHSSFRSWRSAPSKQSAPKCQVERGVENFICLPLHQIEVSSIH